MHLMVPSQLPIILAPQIHQQTLITLQQPALSGEADHGDSESSAQKIIHEIMSSNQLNGSGGMVGVGSLVNDVKNVNGILPTGNNTVFNRGNCLVGFADVLHFIRER
jgi:hypothetical protein